MAVQRAQCLSERMAAIQVLFRAERVRMAQVLHVVLSLGLLCLVAGVSFLPSSSGSFTGAAVNSSNGLTADSLSAPTGVTGVGGAAEVHLSWTTPSSSWTQGYDILRSTASGCCYSLVGSTSGLLSTTYVDETATEGNTYFYVVRSRFGDWASPNSVEASVQTIGGIVALYNFDEGSGSVVADTSGFGVATDLTIADPSSVTWAVDGLTLNSSTIVSNSDSTKLVNAMQSSGELTVETWVTPANLAQGGPVRLFTISQSTGVRDVTFGQEATEWEGRINLTTNSANGLPAVMSGPSLDSARLYHAVLTRDASGWTRIYVDGVEVASRNDGGTFASWSSAGHGVAIGNEMTLDRGWLGSFHRVVIYDRALAPSEVLTLHGLLH